MSATGEKSFPDSTHSWASCMLALCSSGHTSEVFARDCINADDGHVQGSGKQHIGACVNLVSCYCIGLPVAILGGFYLHGSVEGLLAGIICTQTAQAATLATVASQLDWDKLAAQASIAAAASHLESHAMSDAP